MRDADLRTVTAYLTDVLTRLPRLGEHPADAHLEPLLPDRWIAQHPHASLLLNR